jgi:pyruvate kinase
MRRNRRTKLVATLGPATPDEASIEALFVAGADVFRINMSHTDPMLLNERIRQIRAVERRMRRPIGILADLQGPKLRIGVLVEGRIPIGKDDVLELDSDPEPGGAIDGGFRVHLPHPEVLSALRPGDRVLIDDGKLQLRVREANPARARLEIIEGGILSNRKGVSLPDTHLAHGALTPKDRRDLAAALDAGVDYLAISFVQTEADVAEVKKLAKNRALVIAKIEKPQAILHLEAIIEQADALMIARGDLGVEMPLEAVPGLQKRITRLARKSGKPVIVATQMLESMIAASAPTRAEVSDVATAIFEGADAVMLSAESAAGAYPIEAVTMMNRIAETVEADPTYPLLLSGQRSSPEPTGADAIAAAVRSVTETLRIPVILAWTATGATALRIARERPGAPILALTIDPGTARRLALVWGVHPLLGQDPKDMDDMVRIGSEAARIAEFAQSGERIILVAGVPFGTRGATNMLRLAFVG